MTRPLIRPVHVHESGGMETGTLTQHELLATPVRATGGSRLKAIVKKLWFPVALVTAMAVAFVAFGPPSSPNASVNLLAMAPPGAGTGPAVAPEGATATEKEISKYYEMVRQYPDTVTAYLLLGNAYVQHVREKGDPRDYGRAQAAFDEARRREPENADALVGSGVMALARHDFRFALELGTRARDLAPKKTRAYGVIVDAQTELGQYDEAVATSQAMVDLRPDLASYSRVSYQRELHGQIDGAIAAMGQAYKAAGPASGENGEYLRVLMGNLYLLKGDVATAKGVFESSLEAYPGFVWALAGLGRVLAVEGKYEEGIALYQQAVDQIPLPEFVIALGETQEAAGRTQDAQRTYELVAAIQALFQANGVNVDLDIALFEANHGAPARSLELAFKAYERQPNVKAADALAWALYKNGRLDEARRWAEEALKLGTPYGSFLFHAGMIAKDQGDAEAARSWLSGALEKDPYFSPLYVPVAEQALAELGG